MIHPHFPLFILSGQFDSVSLFCLNFCLTSFFFLVFDLCENCNNSTSNSHDTSSSVTIVWITYGAITVMLYQLYTLLCPFKAENCMLEVGVCHRNLLKYMVCCYDNGF